MPVGVYSYERVLGTRWPGKGARTRRVLRWYASCAGWGMPWTGPVRLTQYEAERDRDHFRRTGKWPPA